VDDSLLAAIFAAQDQLITRFQALQVLTEAALRSRLGKRWRVVLPGIYASSLDRLTPRQRLRAALLYAGEHAWPTDITALQQLGLPYLPHEPIVRVAVPDHVQRKSKDFVEIRRTKRPPSLVQVNDWRVAPMARALCEFMARHQDWREAFAVLAAAVQLRRIDVGAIFDEALAGPARGRAKILRAVECLRAGVRSLPENDFRDLILPRRGLPEPLWNCLIELPNGERYSPDGLIVASATITEINGREYHDPEKAGMESFDRTMFKASSLTVTGFTVLGYTPARLRSDGRSVGDQVAAMHHRYDGRGLPPGVRILRYGPPGTPWAVGATAA
jgi:hypothetical protein